MRKVVFFGAAFLLLISIGVLLVKAENSGNIGDEKLRSLSFTVYQPHYGESPLGKPVQEKWQQMMEEYMGMKLDITYQETLWSDYLENISAYLASGNYADVFVILGESLVENAGYNGEILNLMDYRQYLLNYKEWMDENAYFTPEADSNTKMYGFAKGSYSDGVGSQWVFAARFDVFKDNHIDMPESLEELYAAAKALKAIYPNSFPIGSGENEASYQLPSVFFKINHIAQGIYYNGERFVFAPIDNEPVYKSTLEYLHKLYKEGLLDPEFFIQTKSQAWEKAMTGKVFVLPNVFAGQVNGPLKNGDNPDIEWGIIVRPKGFDGANGWKPSSEKPGRNLVLWQNLVISARSQHPDLLVKLLDYQYSDEMWELTNWGIEGETYIRDKNGAKKFMPEFMSSANPSGKLSAYAVFPSITCRPGIGAMVEDWRASVIPAIPVYSDGRYFMDDYRHFTNIYEGVDSVDPNDRPPYLPLNPTEKYLWNSVMPAMDVYIGQSIIQFITGELSFDKWIEFKQNIEGIGDYKGVVQMLNRKLSRTDIE